MFDCARCGKPSETVLRVGTRCTECQPLHQKEYQKEYRQSHRIEIAKQRHDRYWSEPELARTKKRESTERHKPETMARAAKYSKEHPEKRRAYRNIPANRARYQENWRKYWRNNPEKARLRGQRSKARRRAAEAGVACESFTRQSIFKRDGGFCRYCAVILDPKNWHLDHVIPLAKGGPHTPENVVASCVGCNLSKATKIVRPLEVDARCQTRLF